MEDYKKMTEDIAESEAKELMEIKKMARESYENLFIDIIGYEQNPDPWSYMLGYIEGYKKSKNF